MKKKHLFLTLMGAIALTGTVGFTSCSSDDTVAAVEDNPTYDPVAKTVTAQFVLNLASPEMQSTRQSSVTVQQNQNFRGMQDAKLIALSTGKGYDTGNPANNLAPFAGNSTGYGVVKTFDLGTLYAAGQVDNGETDNGDNTTTSHNAESSSRRVLQMSLPLTTDAMLVYARAIPNGSDEENGAISTNMNGATPPTNPEDFTFDLVSRIKNDNTNYEHTLALSAAIINQIFDSNVGEQAAGGTAIQGYTNVATVPALTWKNLGDAYKTGTPALLPLQEVMGKLYYSVTNIKSGEYRAGSSSSVCRLMYSIYKNAETVTSVAATSDAEYNAQRLAKEIMSRIAKYFTEFDSAHDSDSNPPSDKDYELATKFEEISTIQTNLADANFATKYSGVTDAFLAGFPSCFRLPEGVALLSIDSSDDFSYNLPSTTLVNGNNIAAANYMYPSELLYFDNSLLRVNDAAKRETDYPNGYNQWNNPTGSQTWDGWTVGKVASTTRSVAVKNNINYGVAMLQTSVALVGDNSGKFSDNRHGIYTEEENQKLELADVSAFTLKGVLIGGQNHQMGWNYLATGNETTDWDYVIYDTAIPNSGVIPTTAPNYTLVFDNYKAGENSQSDVYVALEFVNNSNKVFYGQHNMIPVGGTFYLVAKLELGSKTIGAWDDYYAIPPYDANGKSQKITRVFVQDYMTSANFQIGPYSLQHAYLTVPDLRSTQISLGLSVDLNWRAGINFGNVLLGGGQIN